MGRAACGLIIRLLEFGATCGLRRSLGWDFVASLKETLNSDFERPGQVRPELLLDVPLRPSR